MRSLIIGRFQVDTPHGGHRAMVQAALDQGEFPVIGIRQMPVSIQNPYYPWEIKAMFHTIYGSQIETHVLPYFEKIRFGRTPVEIEYCDFPDHITKVSATQIRNNGHQIVWLTGNSGSGKTTLANALATNMRCVVLDGDDMRDSISLGAGFSEQERLRHNLKVARLARVLSRQLLVVVAVIAPTERIRMAISDIISPYWVYLKRSLPDRPDYFYDPPVNPHLVIDNDTTSVSEAVVKIMKILEN